MIKFSSKTKRPGLSPGTIIHVGERKTDSTVISLMNYNADHIEEKKVDRLEDFYPLKDTSEVTWINIDGLHQIDVVEKIGTHFGIHPLTLEDIADTNHRPKLEDVETYLFIVMKMLNYDDETEEIEAEQISFVLGKSFLLTFQEAPGDVFDSVRDRIRKGKGKIRTRGADYLTYALIDAVVDHYFYIIETFGKKIETLEEEILDNPTPRSLETIHILKREMIFFRRQVLPLKEIVGSIRKGYFERFHESTYLFLNDVYDHIIHIMETIDSFRDLLTGLLDIYLSFTSNRMNEVMKILTLIATIFMPLTFIAGVYGMNFKYMPELEWRWGYFLVIGIMIGMTSLMLLYFKKKQWL